MYRQTSACRNNSNINKFEKTKATKPKLEIAKQVRLDLKRIDNIVKKEVVIKRLGIKLRKNKQNFRLIKQIR
jgi:hypothetical protein